MAALGDLIVKLSLDSANFEDGIKRFQAQMTKIQGQFKNSATGVTNFDQATAKLKTSADTLTQRLKLQQAEVARLEAAHRNSVQAKGADAAETQKLATKLEAARARVQQTEQALAMVNGQIEKNQSAWFRLQTNLDGVGQKLKTVGDSMSKTGQSLTKAVSVPLAGLGALALKSSIEFESAFAGVRKTVNASEADFKFLEDSIVDMSEKIPKSTTELSGIMEMAGQLGVKGKTALLNFTETIAALGVSTNLTEEDAASMLAQFANITGMNIETEINNLGSVIVALGNNFATTEADIVHMGQRLAGAGSQLGMSEASIMAFAAALSSVGIEAEAGGTAFSKLMINMKVAADTGTKGNEVIAKTGKTLRELQMLADRDAKSFKALANKLGMTSTEFKGMLDATADLENFAKVTGLTAEEFAQKFGEDAPGAIMMFLEGLNTIEQNGGSVITTLDEMGITETRLRDTITRAASATDLFAEAQKLANEEWGQGTALTNEANQRYGTTESQLIMLKNAAKNLAKEFGDLMLPTIQKVIDKLRGLIDWFKGLSESQKETAIKVAVFAAAFGPLLIGIGKVTTAVGSIMTVTSKAMGAVSNMSGAFTKLKGVFAAITGPIGIVITVVGALVAAFVYFYNTNEEFRNKVNEIWGSICAFFQTLPETFNQVVQAIVLFFTNFGTNVMAWASGFGTTLSTFFTGLWAAITSGVSTAWTAIVTWLSGLWTGISTTAMNLWNGITTSISSAVSFCKSAIEFAWNAVVAWLSGLWLGISTTAMTLWNGITTAISTAVTFCKTAIEFAWNAVVAWLSGLWAGISATASSLWNGITSAISTAVATCKAGVEAAWSAVTSFVSGLWNGIKSTATSIWNGITSSIGSAVDSAKQTVNRVWEGVSTTVKGLWTGTKTAATTTWNGIKDAATNATNNAKTALNTTWTNVSSACSTTWSSLKTTASTSWSNITSAVSTAVSNGKSKITSAWETVKSAVSSTWNKVTDIVKKPITTAYEWVQSKVNSFKGLFGFTWSLPKFKLPSVKINWNDTGLGIKIPSFSVSWNKLGGIFNVPTIFGTANAGFQGVGEAGPEAILPLSTLWDELSTRLKSGMREVLRDTRRSEVAREQSMMRVLALALSAQRDGAPSVNVTQHIHANETSYVGQQREAARNFRQIARAFA